MTLTILDAEEREVVRRSLEATFHYFDSEFDARLGVTEEEMRRVLAEWPNVDDSNDDSNACVAINNALNDLLHGEGISDADAIQLTGVDTAEMERIYKKWARGRGVVFNRHSVR
jgi:hypothetical protein